MNVFISANVRLFFISIITVTFYSCAVLPKSATVIPSEETSPTSSRLVITSHYSRKLAGNQTASGELYDPRKLTCAHRTLPFGTMVKVKNPKNQKQVILRINDRGPFIRGRELDISNLAAEQLGIEGVQAVEMEILAQN